jgi:hypothetical protein
MRAFQRSSFPVVDLARWNEIGERLARIDPDALVEVFESVLRATQAREAVSQAIADAPLLRRPCIRA